MNCKIIITTTTFRNYIFTIISYTTTLMTWIKTRREHDEKKPTMNVPINYGNKKLTATMTFKNYILTITALSLSASDLTWIIITTQFPSLPNSKNHNCSSSNGDKISNRKNNFPMAVRSSAEDRAIQVSRSDTCISRCIYTVNRKCKYVYSRRACLHQHTHLHARVYVCVCARSWSQAAETVYIRQVDARASCKRAGAFWIILFIFRHALATASIGRPKLRKLDSARAGKGFGNWCDTSVLL